MLGFWQKLWLRRRFIVDRRFQGEVILRSVLASLFLMLVILLGLFLPLIHEIGMSEGAHPLDSGAVAAAFLYLHEHLLPILGIYLIVATLSAIRFSHRIAGPMVRFKRHMYAIGDGNFPPPLRTRGGDYMQPEVRALNYMSKSLAQHACDLCDAEDALNAALESCEKQLERGNIEAARRSFSAVHEKARELEGRIAFFRQGSEEETCEENADPASTAEAEIPAPAVMTKQD